MRLKCVHGNEGSCYECADIKQFNKCIHGKLLYGQYCLTCISQRDSATQEAKINILNAKVEINETITIKKALWDEMLSYKAIIDELQEFQDETECQLYSMDKKLDNIYEVMNLLDFDKRFKDLERKVNLMKSITQSKCSRCLQPISNLPYYMYDEPSYRFCSVQCMTDSRSTIKSVANCL